ncbi:efflux RND transporter periplasmic adaptor subunit [bacterium]|nr:efflux RND transporter periplasmic adaptor subunit [candidate division CSSED10-310 bacterium]
MTKLPNGVLLLLILIISFGVAGCRSPESRASVEKTETPEEVESAAPVEIQAVEQGTIAEYIETTSNIYADSHVVVYPKTTGQVVRIDVAEGDPVGMDQVLAVIDDEAAGLRVRQLEVTRRQAQEKLERTRQLFENRMVSREAFDDAGYRYDDADVAYRIARLDLGNTRIKSPIHGVVVAKFLGIGDLAGPGSPAFEIFDPASLQIDVFLPEREAGRVQIGMKAIVFPDSIPDQSFNASVFRINPSVDIKTGTVKMTLIFDSMSPELAAGMFVRVRILVDHRESAVLLPKRALIRRKEENRVFVVDDNDKAELRLLTLGLENLHTYEVLSGLQPGDRLVIVGQHTLENGQVVKVMETPILTPNLESSLEAL